MRLSGVLLISVGLALLVPRIGQGEESQTVVLRVFDDGDPIVIDMGLRKEGNLMVTTDSVGRARFEIDGKISADEALTEARIRVWPEGQESPSMDVTARVVGKYLFWGRTGEEPRAMKVPVGTLLFIPPSDTAMEQTVRHAVAVRGESDKVDLKVWTPYKADKVHDAVVRFPEPGTAELSLFDATYSLSIDYRGNILGGSLDSEGHTITRD